MYDVTPMPDLDDEDDLGQYMQDRRVIGVQCPSNGNVEFSLSN
jgi:hypothetical protein